MFRRKSPSGSASGLLLAALLLLPSAAAAENRAFIKPTVHVEQEYDSNVVARPVAQSSAVTRANFALMSRVSSDRGLLEVGGSLNTRKVWEFEELDAADPGARYQAVGVITPRLTAFSSGNWNRFDAFDALAIDGELVRGGRPDLELWQLAGGLGYSLGLRTTVRLSASTSSSDFSEEDDPLTAFATPRFDRETLASSLRLSHELSPRDFGEAVLNYSTNDFSRPQTVSERDSFCGELSAPELEQNLATATAVWARTWTPSLRTTLTGGYTWVESSTRQEGRLDPQLEGFLREICINNRLGSGLELGPDGERLLLEATEDEQSFVGGIEIERAMARSLFRFEYSQFVRPATGARGQQLVNTLEADFSYRFTDRLEGSLQGGWRRFRESRLTGRVDVINQNLRAELSWRSSRRLQWFARVRFFERNSDGEIDQAEFDRVRAGIGVRYSLEQDL